MGLKINFITLAVSATILSTVSAKANTISGSYVSLGAGADITQTQHNTSNFGNNIDVKHKTGYTGFASYGYGFGNGLRTEIEGMYLQSNTKYLAKNHNNSEGGLLNVVYDIDLKRHFGMDVPVTPYVGVGAGYMVDTYHVRSPVRNISGTQGGFAYQGIVGASFDTGVPGLTTAIDYRMIGQPMSNDSFHDGDSHFDHKFNHTFNVSLRYAFNTAPAAPKETPVVTAPAPKESRTYLVFFDWDRSDLSTQAKTIVDRAAEASRNTNVTNIDVSGYSDNSMANQGPLGEKYNLKLSINRANAVKAELVKNGVSANSIEVHGLGDKVQFVRTGPNTREALNRRVVITLR